MDTANLAMPMGIVRGNVSMTFVERGRQGMKESHKNHNRNHGVNHDLSLSSWQYPGTYVKGFKEGNGHWTRKFPVDSSPGTAIPGFQAMLLSANV